MNNKLVIIDLGSNSVRMVIYQVGANFRYRVIDDIRLSVRLIENMVDGKYLNDFSMHKAVKSIKLFKQMCLGNQVYPKNIHSIITSFINSIGNENQFLEMLHKTTNIKFRALSLNEVANYTFSGVINTIPVKDGLIIDIGGGNTQIIQFKNSIITEYLNIPIGSITATENYIQKNKLSTLINEINSIINKNQWISNSDSVIIGIGGVIRTFARIHMAIYKYSLNLIHNYVINVDTIHNVFKTLSNISKKYTYTQLIKDRSDILDGGLAIFKTIVAATKCSEIKISTCGRREGILFEQLSINKKFNIDKVLDNSLNNLVETFSINKNHINHVSYLASTIFDNLIPLHKYSKSEGKILYIASQLHEIGKNLGYNNHHLHTFYFIKNSNIFGLSHREILITAAVAASSKKNTLYNNWYTEYKDILFDSDIKLYHTLSLFLKLADGFDRSNISIIEDLEFILKENLVKIKTYCIGEPELELSIAGEFSDEFYRLFNKKLIII